ncbi:MAG: hypothetical protein CMM87_04815 [Rickettsiales bacterium]|nr:hypothetical protein [Rickettsiales bacterium]|tara:strand:+ start:25902 stop:26588 length:687 start_codon:yes stop_codon:yes gene_type:complete
MKKGLLFSFTLVSPLTLFGSWNEGYYINVGGGYSSAQAQLKDSTTVQLSGQNYGSLTNRNKSKGSYAAGVTGGHRNTFGRKHFSTELGVTYSNANPNIGTFTANVTNAGLGITNGQSYSFHYKPRFGIAGAIRFGYLFMPELLGYLKFGLEYNFGQVTLKADKVTKINTGVTQIVPGIGIESVLSEKLYWQAGADYKIGIKTSSKNSNLSFKKRPQELVTKAGIGYHL